MIEHVAPTTQLVSFDQITKAIHVVRSQHVLLDADLAVLYGVETRVLVQAVKRNIERFPSDFMFRLSAEEFATLTSQIVISSVRGGRRHRPYAFTEQGVAMLSSVLRSKHAVRVNIDIMRAFVALRRIVSSHRTLARKLIELERRYDAQFKVVFAAIRELVEGEQSESRRPIGFSDWDE
jgi:hypothetical protein